MSTFFAHSSQKRGDNSSYLGVKISLFLALKFYNQGVWISFFRKWPFSLFGISTYTFNIHMPASATNNFPKRDCIFISQDDIFLVVHIKLRTE